MATKIILIRHGQTSFNSKKIYCSFSDAGLNMLGIKQAEKLRARLTRENIHRVYSSDFKRAFQFAKLVFKGFIIEKSTELREMDFGIFEGLTHNQISKRYPKLYRAWLNDPFNTVIPNGDRLYDFSNRIRLFLKKIIAANKNKTIAFVTHGGPIKVIMSDILKTKNIWKVNAKPGSVNIIEYKNG
jgi:alpha-ribazole phosphatase